MERTIILHLEGDLAADNIHPDHIISWISDLLKLFNVKKHIKCLDELKMGQKTSIVSIIAMKKIINKSVQIGKTFTVTLYVTLH